MALYSRDRSVPSVEKRPQMLPPCSSLWFRGFRETEYCALAARKTRRQRADTGTTPTGYKEINRRKKARISPVILLTLVERGAAALSFGDLRGGRTILYGERSECPRRQVVSCTAVAPFPIPRSVAEARVTVRRIPPRDAPKYCTQTARTRHPWRTHAVT